GGMDVWDSLITIAAGAGLCAWGGLHPQAQLFGRTLRRVPSGIALTFADGTHPDATPVLLRLLRKYQVHATFFVLGKNVRQYPALAAEIVGHNHQIGNHTESHDSLLFWSPARIVEELRRCEEAIHTATGARSNSVRPPFGY